MLVAGIVITGVFVYALFRTMPCVAYWTRFCL